ncbi:MAG: glycosyltransferase [Methylococcaceae bacterium]|jgi:hypothetical protein
MTKNTGTHVLITNNTLAHRAGSEMYVLDIALALLKRGYNPIAYSTVLGDVADELRKATIPVINNLNALVTPPDLIHGQHHLDAMTAMLRFPTTPALYFCHGWLPWEETPPLFPTITHYVAVDNLCQERLLTTAGIKQNAIRLLYNFVDLAQFKPRLQLPEKPKAALVFSNNAAEHNFVSAIRAACLRFGIERIDVAGFNSGNVAINPAALLPQYDVVFAKARCALEAMAVGCAVVVADLPGLGGMVSTGNMKAYRRLNFGVRTLQTANITEANIFAQLLLYNPNDAHQVSAWIRQDADSELAFNTLETYYQEALAMAPSLLAQPSLAISTAASAYLQSLAPVIKTRILAEQRAIQAEQQQSQLQQLNEHHQLALQNKQTELDSIINSRTWQLFSYYRKFRRWLASW